MGTGGPKVLIVDDDANVARAFARILTQGGYRTTIANNGRHALACVDEEPFDVVISDVSMPEMGGIELLTEVFRRDADLPVILITGGVPFECDACQCLTKPISPDDLLRAALRAAGRHRLALLRGESPERFGDRPGLAATVAPRVPSASRRSLASGD